MISKRSRRFSCAIFSLFLLPITLLPASSPSLPNSLQARAAAMEETNVLSGEALRSLLAEVVERQKRQGARTMQFSEERSSPLLVDIVHSSGVLYFSPPKAFRRDTITPSPATSVSDGKTLWLAYPEFGEIEEYSLAQSGVIARELDILLAGLNLQDLERNFRVRAFPFSDGHLLELVPKTRRGHLAGVWLALRKDFSAEAFEVLGKDGNRSVMTFSNEKPFVPSAATFSKPTLSPR